MVRAGRVSDLPPRPSSGRDAVDKGETPRWGPCIPSSAKAVVLCLAFQSLYKPTSVLLPETRIGSAFRLWAGVQIQVAWFHGNAWACSVSASTLLHITSARREVGSGRGLYRLVVSAFYTGVLLAISAVFAFLLPPWGEGGVYGRRRGSSFWTRGASAPFPCRIFLFGWP